MRNYNLKDDKDRTEDDSVLNFFHKKSHGKLNNDMGNIMEFGTASVGGTFAPKGSSPDNRKENHARVRKPSYSPDYTKERSANDHMTSENINDMIRPSAVGRKNA